MPFAPVFVCAVVEEMRCGYRSKRCEHPRSFKRNGELHRFCDYHRTKANDNQRRVDQKRRDTTQKKGLDVSSPRSAQDASLLPDSAWYEDLDPQDLEYLDRLLSSGEDVLTDDLSDTSLDLNK